MWQEYNRVRVTARATVCVYACVVYVPPLLWSGKGMWMESLCAPKNSRKPFLSLRQWLCAARGAGRLMNGSGGGLWKAWPCSPRSPLPLFCTPDCSLQQRQYQTCTSWRQGQRVTSLVTSLFCLEHTFTQNHPHHFLSLQLNTSLRCVQINALLKAFLPLYQQVKSPSCLNNGGRRRLILQPTQGRAFKKSVSHYIRLFLLYLTMLNKCGSGSWHMTGHEAGLKINRREHFKVFIPSQQMTAYGGMVNGSVI